MTETTKRIPHLTFEEIEELYAPFDWDAFWGGYNVGFGAVALFGASGLAFLALT